MTRGIEEGDAALRCLHVIRTDVLRDATGFARGHLGLADVVEQGRPSQNSSRIVGQGRLNVNRANESELDGLPGVGPVLAQRIIAYRTEHGNFGTVEDLQKVAGIGPAKFSELRTFVTV